MQRHKESEFGEISFVPIGKKTVIYTVDDYDDGFSLSKSREGD